MNTDTVKQLIEAHIPGATVFVSGDGSKFEATVISEAFEGLTGVKQHQLIYGAVNEHIASGEIHALSIQAYTPAEWEARSS